MRVLMPVPAALSKALSALVLSLVTASSALAEDSVRPDPRLTPGAVATTDTATICRIGYAKRARHTSGKLKALIYREYGITRAQRAGGSHYEIDHLIPLGLGGADVAKNLRPESFDIEPWNATRKNRLEDYLHAEVCAGRVPIEQAQRDIGTDWIGAYERYWGSHRLSYSAWERPYRGRVLINRDRSAPQTECPLNPHKRRKSGRSRTSHLCQMPT